jgi:hypothetical protein
MLQRTLRNHAVLDQVNDFDSKIVHHLGDETINSNKHVNFHIRRCFDPGAAHVTRRFIAARSSKVLGKRNGGGKVSASFQGFTSEILAISVTLRCRSLGHDRIAVTTVNVSAALEVSGLSLAFIA